MRLRLTPIAVLLASAAPAAAQTAPILYANPISLPTEDGPLIADEGYVSVPENRKDAHSKPILIQFYRFKALKPSGRPPVFMLPGGPGDLLDRRDFDKKRYPHFTIRKMLRRLLVNRDVVIVNQRGNFWLLDNFGGFKAEAPTFPATVDPDQEQLIAGWKQSLTASFAMLKANGTDLAGYDIRNSVEDIEDVRRALSYDKIVLNGFSYGSQWGLAYIRVHPEHVARAEFSGVEPLDYGYDSSDTLWATLQRIAAAAEASPIAAQLPPGGLAKAVVTILDRLEKVPAQVTITNPETGKPLAVTIRREDFQALLLRPWSGKMLRDGPAMWPKFITEVYNGDYRYVALRKLGGLFPFNGNINLPLIDHSLGISPARDKALLAEPARAIVGDTNLFYRRWQDAVPTAEVGDDFRVMRPIDVPVLLVQGDMDWSTPMENALDQGRHLRTGAVMVVHTGTHITGYEVLDLNPEAGKLTLDFLDLDAQPNPDPKAFLDKVPKRVDMPLDFVAPTSMALYDRLMAPKAAAK